MAFLRCSLQSPEHLQDLRPFSGTENPLVEVGVVDLCLHASLAGLLQTGETGHRGCAPGIGRDRQVVAAKQGVQGLDVPQLRIADVQERTNGSKVLQHLGIHRPGVVLVVEGIVKRSDFSICEGRHGMPRTRGQRRMAGTARRQKPTTPTA